MFLLVFFVGACFAHYRVNDTFERVSNSINVTSNWSLSGFPFGVQSVLPGNTIEFILYGEGCTCLIQTVVSTGGSGNFTCTGNRCVSHTEISTGSSLFSVEISSCVECTKISLDVLHLPVFRNNICVSYCASTFNIL
jgi:hypothetical protein